MAKNYNKKGRAVDMNRDSNGLNININPDDMTDVLCDKCGCQTFVPAFLFKHLSAVMSPNGKDTMVPLQVFKCDECGHINEKFLPKSAKPTL